VTDRSQLRQPPGVVAFVLLVCTLVGLFAGFGTRQLVTRLANAANLDQNGLGPHGTTGVVIPTSTATLLPAPTSPAALSSEFTGFSIQAQVSPNPVAPGQQFTITATVIAKDGVTPLGGVSCTIGGSLLPQWPAGKVSNANGKATWSLRAPSVSKGAYTVKVSATGYKGYFYFTLVSVTITS
jgi:hypothetical protein